jgi:hypothetical protein
MASTMAYPNFKNGLKMAFGPLAFNKGFNSGFNSDLKVSLLSNISQNKYKELLPTKLQFKVDRNPTWLGSWMQLDALFHYREGSANLPLKIVIRASRSWTM